MISHGRNPAGSLLVVETGRALSAPGNRAPTAPGFPWSDRHLGRLFSEVAGRECNRLAITSAGEEWSYGRLLAAARTVADRLSKHVEFLPGELYILLLPNSSEYNSAFYVVLLAGGVVVPTPPKTEAGLLRQIVESTAARIIATRAQIVQSRVDLNGLPADTLDLSRASSPGDLPAIDVEALTGNELAAIFFTAGSTGSAKGVMLSHRNLIANARAIQEYLALDRTDRPLCVLPFHHAFGNSILQSHLLAGAHIILDGQTTFPDTIIKALRKHDCTSFSAVPDLFRGLLERSSMGQASLPALRYMAVAGGALRHDLALEVGRRIAPAEFFAMYGQTEATARLAYVPPRELAALSDGAIGRAVPGVTLQVVDERGVEVAPGAIGELRARGPGVMLGYWDDTEATDECLRDGWLYTGDLATVDARGWIIHKGRRNALVKIAGFRVHPSALEEDRKSTRLNSSHLGISYAVF